MSLDNGFKNIIQVFNISEPIIMISIVVLDNFKWLIFNFTIKSIYIFTVSIFLYIRMLMFKTILVQVDLIIVNCNQVLINLYKIMKIN